MSRPRGYFGLAMRPKHPPGDEASGQGSSSKRLIVDTSTCRGRAAYVVSCAWFDSAVVGLILVNCVFLALDDPTEEVRLRTVQTNRDVHGPSPPHDGALYTSRMHM